MTVVSGQWSVVGENTGAKLMSRKILVWLLATVSLATTSSANAQQLKKIARIGFLAANPIFQRHEAFREGLRELGYVEGKNIVIEWRTAEGQSDRLPSLAADLVRLNVAVIVTAGAASTRPAKVATTTIPIVMALDNDPVGSGFVASLARPGGNITGLSQMAPELAGKRLEILKEVVPRLSRVAVLGEFKNPGNAQALKETELAAVGFGLQLQSLDVRSPTDIEIGFREAAKGRADAAIVLGGPITTAQQGHIVEIAAKNRLPVICPQSDYMNAGGLMFYGPSISDLYRRAAVYVDKILKGAKPADLPVEQPAKFELIINLKTAKQIGLTIPPNVLARANRVIR
jgi:putative tryptophan/tyrosine transport system substrate-binding protein